MIQSFTITNFQGDSIELELRRPEKSGFLIYSVEGLGPAKANINTTEVSTKDGSFYNSARLETRNIIFSIMFFQTGSETIEDLRQKSYKYFPLKKKTTIKIKTDNRELQTVGYIESNEPDIFSKDETAKISVICPDPYFYGAGKYEKQTTVFYGIEPLFQFPFSNESLTDPLLEFGSIGYKSSNVITYTGDADVGMTIHLHATGNVSNVTIANSKTREVMYIDTDKLAAITGYGIIDKDEIIINTNRGEKSIVLIREGITTNILNVLGKDSSWLQLTKGDNVLGFAAEDGLLNLQFWIENKIVFEGV